MTIVAADEGRASIDIGGVIRETFERAAGRWATFIGLGLLGGLPTVGARYWRGQVSDGPAAASGYLLLFTILSVFSSLLVTGALIHATAKDAEGRTSSVGEMLTVGLRRCGTVFMLSLVMALGVAVASLLLIVPGMILLSMWLVALPVAVLEDADVSGALERSGRLTKGSRWQVFALWLLYLVAVAILYLVATMGGLSDSGPSTPFGMVLDLIVTAVIAVLANVGSTVLYRRLRAEKEGHAAGGLAEVFD